MINLSFDTGYNIGFSIVDTKEKKLLDYGQHIIPPKQSIEKFCELTENFILSFKLKQDIKIDNVLIEVPVFYDTPKSRVSAKRGDLFFVHASAITIFNSIIIQNKFLIMPNKWKGQMSKHATNVRIRAIIGNQVNNIKSEHILDSIGIGLSQDKEVWDLLG